MGKVFCNGDRSRADGRMFSSINQVFFRSGVWAALHLPPPTAVSSNFPHCLMRQSVL
jgi:hypothetical protein